MSERIKDPTRDTIPEEIPEETVLENEDQPLSTDDFARAAGNPVAQESQPVTETTPLMAREEERDFRSRWDAIQNGFVDAPRDSVQQADSLVAEVMQLLATTFSDERKKLEAQWSQGKEVSTEDLRIALQKYRSFFGRLLSI